VLEHEIVVPFEGEGEGSDRLTWGQVAFWHCMRDSGQSATMGGVAPMPEGSTVENVIDMLRYLLGRHQSLRTRLWFGPDGEIRQVCSASGEVSLRIAEVEEADPAEVAEQLCREFAQRNFDYRNEWPVRMAAVTKHGQVTHVVAMYLHLALDAGGLEAMLADLFSRDPVTGEPAGPITAVTPLEQASLQRRPAARRQSASALAHLEQVMRSVTPKWFAAPRRGGEPHFDQIRYSSPAIALAVARIAAEQNANSSSALLATFAVGLARFTGDNPIVAMLMVSNRFRPRFADSVSSLVQISPYLIDVAEINLGEAVARARTSLLHTYKSAYYDHSEQELVIDRVSRELGHDFDFCCLYNDRRKDEPLPVGWTPATDQQILDALPASGWAREYQADMSDRKLFVSVDDPPGAVELVLSADSRYFGLPEIIGLVQAIEAAAVEAALTPQAPTRVPAAASNPPQRRLVDQPAGSG
jgi:Condensation domain